MVLPCSEIRRVGNKRSGKIAINAFEHRGCLFFRATPGASDLANFARRVSDSGEVRWRAYEPVTSRSLRPSVERGAVRRPRLTCVTPNALSINGKLSPVNNEAPASGGVRCMFQLAAMSTFGVGGCTSVPAFPEFPYMEPAPV